MTRSTFVVAVLLALAAPAAAQGVADLLNNPSLMPFVTAVLDTPECIANISGSGLSNFDIKKCPSLPSLLDNTNLSISCETSCSKQFELLDNVCIETLMDKFTNTTDVNPRFIDFFVDCVTMYYEPPFVPHSPLVPMPSGTPGVLPTALLSLLSLVAATFALLA